MAEDPVRRRSSRRAAKRIERQRRKALATPARKRAEVSAITRADSTGTARPWLPRPATAAAKLAR